jgi:xanthine/uracil/vitamin C permease (AzgA family)
MARRIGGAILIGIVVTTLAGLLRGLSQWPSHIFSLPHPGGTLFKLNLGGAARIGLSN